MLNIGLDVDGVLADFYNSYYKFFNMPSTTVLDGSKMTKACNTKLIYERDFWVNMPMLYRPNFSPTLICTKRNFPVDWTLEFLLENGINEVPIIQIKYEENKSTYLKNKNIDVFIEDTPENMEDLIRHGIPCLLLDGEFNKHYNTPYRIYSLNYDEIERVYSAYFLNI